jgi:hypothetical protein
MEQFDALTLALEDWFERPLGDLPDALRQRVEREFVSLPWERLTADQRRSVASQLDYQHDPATEKDRQFWLDFFVRVDELKKQVAEWEAVATPTAAELATKEARLAELKQELARMEAQKEAARGDYLPERKPCPQKQDEPDGGLAPAVRYIAYPKAMHQLAQRLGASPEELAVWIFTGPELGGIAAYVNANELDPPPRFSYSYFVGSSDYIAPLMACWFRVDDVEQFEPCDRYILGTALIERWNKRAGLHAEAFIQAKIEESRLTDIHPICGGTRGTFSEHSDWPPLESGLFALEEVSQIEAQDFSQDDALIPPIAPAPELTDSEKSAQSISIASTPASTPVRASTAQREVRKLQTQKRHSLWQKAYRKSQKEHPGKSDVWHSKRIANMDEGRGTSPDTIRKNMKKHK